MNVKVGVEKGELKLKATNALAQLSAPETGMCMIAKLFLKGLYAMGCQ